MQSTHSSWYSFWVHDKKKTLNTHRCTVNIVSIEPCSLLCIEQDDTRICSRLRGLFSILQEAIWIASRPSYSHEMWNHDNTLYGNLIHCGTQMQIDPHCRSSIRLLDMLFSHSLTIVKYSHLFDVHKIPWSQSKTCSPLAVSTRYRWDGKIKCSIFSFNLLGAWCNAGNNVCSYN